MWKLCGYHTKDFILGTLKILEEMSISYGSSELWINLTWISVVIHDRDCLINFIFIWPNKSTNVRTYIILFMTSRVKWLTLRAPCSRVPGGAESGEWRCLPWLRKSSLDSRSFIPNSIKEWHPPGHPLRLCQNASNMDSCACENPRLLSCGLQQGSLNSRVTLFKRKFENYSRRGSNF